MSELENEIKSDKEFIEKVADRIYKDTDDWEETIAEPEWIDRMTEIADRYIERFEVTRKLADKWLQSKQVELNDNQQIVLDWAKSYLSETKNIGWFIEELAFLPTTGGKMRYKEVAYVYESLSSQEKIGFLNAVIAWAQEQEGETE